ncbi:MAG: MarR family transcriptional regulator [Clostridia bacterium]|nr:MarR family transcriptional regulator [Clostridia bacterium]
MSDISVSGQKFSKECAMRALGVLAKHSKCSAETVARELGVSKTTACRVLKFLKDRGVIKLYPYKSIIGRGAKPDEYLLHPKTSGAVVDLRRREMSLYVYPLPGRRRSVFTPKILISKPDSEKEAILFGDCFRNLYKRIPPERILFLCLIRDDGDDRTIPADIAGSHPVFAFSETDLLSADASKNRPEGVSLYFSFRDSGAEAKVFLDSKPIRSESVEYTENEAAIRASEFAVSLCEEFAGAKISFTAAESLRGIAEYTERRAVGAPRFRPFDPHLTALNVCVEKYTGIEQNTN